MLYTEPDKQQRRVTDRAHGAELDPESGFHLAQIRFDQERMGAFGGEFKFFSFCVQDALFPFQGFQQVPVGTFRASGRQAAGQHDHVAVSGGFPGEFCKTLQIRFGQGRARFVQFGNALPVQAVYLHVGADVARNGQELMLQAFPVHDGGQVRGAVFAHQADTLYVKAQPFRDDGHVDAFTALVHPGFPDPVDLAGLQPVHADGFIETGIQTNGCDHAGSPIKVYSNYYIIPYPCAQLTIPFPTCLSVFVLFVAVRPFFW